MKDFLREAYNYTSYFYDIIIKTIKLFDLKTIFEY